MFVNINMFSTYIVFYVNCVLKCNHANIYVYFVIHTVFNIFTDFNKDMCWVMCEIVSIEELKKLSKKAKNHGVKHGFYT